MRSTDHEVANQPVATPPVRGVGERRDPVRGEGEHQDYKVVTQPVATTLPVRGEDDEVINTQSIANDGVTKTQSIAEKISDLRGYMLTPRLCSTQDDEVTKNQSVVTLPIR